MDGEEHDGGAVGGDGAHTGRGEEGVVEVDQVSSAQLYRVNIAAGREVACDWWR